MQQRPRVKQICSIALGLSMAFTTALAIEEKSLPAFSVVRDDGSSIASTALTDVNQYALLYLVPGCKACDSLLAMLNDPESPELAKRVVIIVRSGTPQAAKYIHEHVPSEVRAVTWYADSNDDAYRALQFTGTPDLVGVRGGRIIWSINGVLNDSTTVRSVLRKWVKY
jgi:hypothetical protein